MQQAIPYKRWHTNNTFPGSSQAKPKDPTNLGPVNPTVPKRKDNMMRSVVDENALIVFGRRGCCMSHVVRRLLLGLGVNPAVYEVNERDEQLVVAELGEMAPTSEDCGRGLTLPTLFIGGQWFGGLDRVMALHITGELTPILRQAGALWL